MLVTDICFMQNLGGGSMESTATDKEMPCGLNISPSSHLCEISFNMLIDRLKPIEFLHVPKRSVKRFRWFMTIPDDTIPDLTMQRDLLLLCHIEIAEQLLQNNPSCVCLALARADSDLSWIEKGHYQNRIIVFKGEKRFFYYDSILHGIFINDLIWENEMDRIVYAHGRLERLIAVSEASLGNFICICDSGYNLNVCSRIHQPQSKEMHYLTRNNSLSKAEIDFLESKVIPFSSRKRHIILCPADSDHPYPTLHMPVFIDGDYLFHIIMECVNGSPESLRDVFSKFSKRVVALCTEFWRNTVNVDTPWHRVLISLLEGDVSTSDYLETQLSMTAIPQANRFRLLYLRFDPLSTNLERMNALENMRKFNDGMCYPFMYKDDIVALIYSLSKSDAALAAPDITPDVRKLIFEPFGTCMGTSQVFFRIEDLHNAYRQACIAFEMRNVLAREIELINGEVDLPVSPFEHCLKYYLLVGDADCDLIQYSFQSSILKRLVDEDKESGTEISHLLWVYLSCDKNATETAKRVHVHRNTVLYHIERLEKRFGLDFDSPFLRNRIVLDYQQLLLAGAI